jgi:hypothetical protein
MTAHLFTWRDMQALQNQRERSVFLDSALVLTRGQMLLRGALLSSIVPSSEVFTCVVDGLDSNPASIIGQFIHPPASSTAHLTFLTPDEAVATPLILELLDYMAILAGQRGALRLLADVDELSEAFESMRRSGYAIFSRQRIWKLEGRQQEKNETANWRSANHRDAGAIRALYNNVVPGLVQQVEPFDAQRPRGLVHDGSGEVHAYVELRYGRRGIGRSHSSTDAQGLLESFINESYAFPAATPGRYSSAFVLPILAGTGDQDSGAEAGLRQAVMVNISPASKILRPLALFTGKQPARDQCSIAQVELNQTDHGTA